MILSDKIIKIKFERNNISKLQKKKILFLFYRSPLGFNSSNDKRQYLIYTQFKKNCETRILTFGDQNSVTEEQVIIKLKPSHVIKIFNFIFRLKSPRMTHYFSKKYKNILNQILNSYKPDFIYVEHIVMMQYIINMKTKAKLIFFNDESQLFLIKMKLVGNFYQKLRNTRLNLIEMNACSKAEAVFTITENEEKFLYKIGYKNVLTIPYGVDKDYFIFNWKMPEEKSILFLGDFSHYPNRQAIRFIINHIMPNLIEQGVNLKVIGRNTNRIKSLIKGSIELYDGVPDVRPYYYNASVFVAPIFAGGGLRVKILEAALCGLPLVISPIANLGINLDDKKEAFICSSKVEFNNVLKSFFNSKFDNIIDLMRVNARNKISSEFDEKVIEAKMESVFSKIIFIGADH